MGRLKFNSQGKPIGVDGKLGDIDYRKGKKLQTSDSLSFLKEDKKIGDIFEKWSQGELSSFLMDISVDVLRKKDDGDFLLDVIVDRAGQKGTGRWTTEEALRLGVPAPSLANSVLARAF